MGRAGSGSVGGSRSSGSRSSGSRSSGSHRVGEGGSRAGSGTRSSFGDSSFSSHSAPRYSPPRHHYHHDYYPRHHHHHHYGHTNTVYVGTPSRSSSIAVTVFMILIILFCFLKIGTILFASFAPAGTSTIERHKLESSYSYDNNNIVDEIGWFDNVGKTSGRLQDFYKETGVQPYIVLKDYDPALKNDAAKEEYAEQYFAEEELNENGFLFMYFAEENVDGDVGLMCYVNGLQATSVMDSEAVDIFWNYVDRYWYTDMSTDDMFVKIFNETSDVIMRVSTTGKDIVLWLVILVVVIVVGSIIVRSLKLRNERKAAEAEEAAKILSAPLEKLADEDDLADKYTST